MRSASIALLPALLLVACSSGSVPVLSASLSGTKVLLVWDVPGAGDLSFELQQARGSTGAFADVPIPPLFHVKRDTVELPADAEATTFFFRVRVRDAGAWSNVASVTTRLVAPAGFRVQPQGASGAPPFLLSWTNPSRLATRTVLERRLADPKGRPLGDWSMLPVTFPETSFFDDDVADWIDGTMYQYRLRNEADTSSSESVEGATAFAPPLAPVGLQAELTPTGVRVSWTPRSKVANGAVLHRHRVSGGLYDPSDLATAGKQLQGQGPYVDRAPPSGALTYSVQALVSDALWTTSEETAPVYAFVVDDPSTPLPTPTEMPVAGAATRAGGAWWLASETGYHFEAAEDFTVTTGTKAGDFQTTTVGRRPSDVAHPGVLVDEQGTAHALYHAPGTTAFVHAWSSSSGWHEETIARANYADRSYQQDLDFALEPSGAVHAVWLAGQNAPEVEYGTNRSGTWVIEKIVGVGDLFSYNSPPPIRRVAVRPDGRPLVVFATGGHGYVAERSASGWQLTPLPTAINPTNPDRSLLSVVAGIDWATIVTTRGIGYDGAEDVVAWDLTSAGFGPETVIWHADDSYTASFALAALGRRIALTTLQRTGVEVGVLQLHAQGEDGTWTTTPLVATSRAQAVGFDADGSVWVLDGLGHTALLYEL